MSAQVEAGTARLSARNSNVPFCLKSSAAPHAACWGAYPRHTHMARMTSLCPLLTFGHGHLQNPLLSNTPPCHRPRAIDPAATRSPTFESPSPETMWAAAAGAIRSHGPARDLSAAATPHTTAAASRRIDRC